MPTSDEFIRFAGEMAESLNFSRSIGQIYGYLYISPTPQSLDDIAKNLSMSKGNASINLRTLESWGAVRPLSQVGSRKDYYEADRDVKKLALRRLQEGMGRRLDHAEKLLDGFIEAAQGRSEDVKRLQELRSLLSKGRKALGFLAKWFA